MRKFLTGILVASATIMIALTGCNKEGPAGANGKDGKDGADAIATCKECHNPTVVDRVVDEYALSKHSYGATAGEETGNTTCGVCHEQEGFRYVCANNTSTVFTYDAGSGKWINPYMTVSSSAFGSFSCKTCHSSLHTTYGYSDIAAFTTTGPVPMTMWGGAKTINLTQGGGKSNLCIKCHQPRPLTCSATTAGRLLNYDSLANFPNVVFYDSAAGATNIYVKPSYRMHVHYGAVGAVYAGVGGIEIPGATPYTSSPHATVATCQDCHMAPITGGAGGHTFMAKGNFNGCNVSGCHASSPISATSNKWTATRSDVKALLDQLATKINACGGGHDILHKEADATLNLWAGISTGNYDGYLDIYSSSTNPLGYWRDPYGSGATNAAKPKFPLLKNAQVAAMINFQFCLREYSLGIHNTQYSTALLQNSIDALTALGF
ncbi:MAG: hypothetical protein WCL06_13865 [Bacteroidota bacterium]